MKTNKFIIVAFLLILNCKNDLKEKENIIVNFIQDVLINHPADYSEIEKLTNKYNKRETNYSQEEIAEIIKKKVNNSFEDILLLKYLDIDTEKKIFNEDVLYFSKFYLLSSKESIKSKNLKNYEVLNYHNATKNSIISNSDVFKKLNYENHNNLFFAVFNGNDPEILFFVVEKNKIISFFGKTIRTSKNEPIIPYILN